MDRGGGIAMWRQIEDRLKGDIARGTWKPGERLPTEGDLAERFGVNRHTLRRAVASLRDAGVLRVEQGRGTFVRDDMIDYAVAPRTRFSENIARLARQPGGRVVRRAVIPASTEIAQALDMRRGQKVVLIEAVNMVDGRPVSIVAHHFPQHRFKGIDAAYQETGSITRALARYGVADYLRKTTRIQARLPETGDADLLDMPRTQPILHAESINVDTGGIPVEYTVARIASHRMQIVVEF
jgi:GntR family transcriptional regulator, phosphonate transport system regulatory protein